MRRKEIRRLGCEARRRRLYGPSPSDSLRTLFEEWIRKLRHAEDAAARPRGAAPSRVASSVPMPAGEDRARDSGHPTGASRWQDDGGEGGL